MESNPTLEQARRALRMTVCRQCDQRWPGRLQSPSSPHVCEPTCTIFASLPQLILAAAECPPEASVDEVIRRSVCMACIAGSSEGDFCGDRITRTCPLSRYAEKVLATLRGISELTKSNAEY